MPKRVRFLLIGAIVGLLIALVITLPVAFIDWQRNAPELSDLRDTVDESLNFNEEEKARIDEMLAVGRQIDMVSPKPSISQYPEW